MTKKIFKNILVVSIIVLFVCVLGISYVLYGYFGEIIKDELKTEAYLISREIDVNKSHVKNLGNMENRVTLIDVDGRVLYDSAANKSTMENHSDREEIIKAQEDGEAYAERYSDTLATKTIYYAKRLDDGSVLRIAKKQSVVMLLLRGIFPSVILILAGVIALTFIISKSAAQRIVEPINEMDLNDPNADEPYSELAPLMIKIRQQNTHIKLQLAEMERRQKEFIAITENMSEGFLLIDRNLEILSYNTAALNLLGEGISKIPQKAFELNRSKGFRTAVEKALAGQNNQQPLETENRFYNILANPVIEEDHVAGAVVIIMDVTEKEQRDKLRREFTSNVSHELKTPLTTIYGVSDMMAEGIVKASDVRGFGKNIKDESSRMISLIDDIIKLSKLDENMAPQEFTNVDIFEIAKSVIERLKSKADEKNITFSLDGERSMIKGIPSLCDEIVFNLCENAIKYNQENGSVNVSVKSGRTGTVLSVEDTGIGIPFEHQNRVFERFFRVDKSHCQQVTGTGLGLSIVKNAVSYLGGTLDLQSTEGKGTKITIYFPN